MTIGSIILCVLLTIVILAITLGLLIKHLEEGASAVFWIVTPLIALVLIGGLWWFAYFWQNNTESGRRELKTQDSNFHGGIEREVTVYDMNGDVIEHFQGKFDVEYKDERVMFDDENGNRHIIYFKSGTVIINEISQEETND